MSDYPDKCLSRKYLFQGIFYMMFSLVGSVQVSCMVDWGGEGRGWDKKQIFKIWFMALLKVILRFCNKVRYYGGGWVYKIMLSLNPFGKPRRTTTFPRLLIRGYWAMWCHMAKVRVFTDNQVSIFPRYSCQWLTKYLYRLLGEHYQLKYTPVTVPYSKIRYKKSPIPYLTQLLNEHHSKMRT